MAVDVRTVRWMTRVLRYKIPGLRQSVYSSMSIRITGHSTKQLALLQAPGVYNRDSDTTKIRIAIV